ncbi:MAG: hypothetical protein ACI4VL_04795 [Bacilli bacterium]
MKKDDIKTMIVVLVICIICVIIIFIFNRQSKNESNNQLETVSNSNMYFMAINYVNYYVNNISMQNEKVIYDILDKTFIEKNGITPNNVFEKISSYPQNSSVKVKEMDYLNIENDYIFHIEGIVYQDNIDGRTIIDNNFSIIITVSNSVSAFSIYPVTNDKLEKIINDIKKINITKNDNNGLIPAELVNKEKMCILYMTDFIDNIYNSNDNGYSLLSNSMKQKYETLENYQNIINSNLDKISTVADKCNVRKKNDNNKIYTVIDKNNNTFTFTENAIMNYVVDFELNSYEE